MGTVYWYVICRRCRWSVRVPIPEHRTGWAIERQKMPRWAMAEYRDHWLAEHADGTTRRGR